MKFNTNIIRSLVTVVLMCMVSAVTAQTWNVRFAIGTSSGKLSFTYNETPETLADLHAPVVSGNPSLVYQWELSTSAYGGFTAIIGATQSSYSFPGPLSATTYYRKKVTNTSTGGYIFSNVVRMELVGSKWEDRNYVREHSIVKSGITTWTAADALAIGEKLETSAFFDGLGRGVQTVSRETATPPVLNGLWGDHVQFVVRDDYGRQPNRYLPYTTTTESGKYKTTALTEQQNYYSINYSETHTYSSATYDNSPLNRVVNSKAPGQSWANGLGSSAAYELNDITDEVQRFTIGYSSGAIPVHAGAYNALELFKNRYTGEDGKEVIEYSDKSGQVILTKTQLDNAPAGPYQGWICKYFVYDDFGRLRYEISPEAVEYLRNHSWSFAGTDGPDVLDGLCSWYEYDERGRVILKKSAGAKELRMLYDLRDRLVFTQDGNQSMQSPPEWTAILYDDLDRPVITTLYKTSKTVAQLQSDIDNALLLNTVTISNANIPVTDLVVDQRDVTIGRYAAQNSIEFVSVGGLSFESVPGDDFVAEIDGTAVTAGHSVTTAIFKNPISQSDLNNGSLCTVLKYQFYDDYSFAGAKSFETDFQNSVAYSNGHPDVQTIASSKRVINYPTGNMVRVLGTNQFLATTAYFDEEGRLIQTIEENIKSGKDVVTMQYQWDGRLLSIHSKHTTVNTGCSNYSIITKNLFDKLGRVTSVMKKYGSNGFKTVVGYQFDDLGRIKKKTLAPGYTGTGSDKLEDLTFSYNIHGNLTGINKDYALKTGLYDKWSHFFGQYLGYDNRDNVFTAANLTGQLTGVLWNSQGDDAQRKYDYTYDNAGRLSKSLFTERATTGDSWSNLKMDFSVTGASGKISYDLNGNLLSMIQRGVLPGSQNATDIDILQYSYQQYSNLLVRVIDNSPIGNSNGAFGDFKDGANGTTNDYVYDDNGNIILDLNKGMKDLPGAGTNGIKYNYLDKPEEIRIAGKGTVKIVYDATGRKLQKLFTPEGSSVTKTTTYIQQFVYEENSLQYINFEEGRIRVIQAVNQGNGYDALSIDGGMVMPGDKKGVFDYFIHDYQQNIRMVLTDETHYSVGKCTMENERGSVEEPVFGKTGSGNEVVTTREGKPGAWQSNVTAKVSKLSKLSGKTIGPNSLLRVMAGDELNASAIYYYASPVTNNSNSVTSDVLNSIIGAITGSSATNSVTKQETTSIYNHLSGTTPFNNITNPHQYSGDNLPRAYLTVLFFDERFNYVSEGSEFIRTSQSGDGASPLVLSYVKAPKNGFAFIYVSNESDEAVYFDDLQVSHTRGRIIEENHYYSFGLKIAAISSRKLGASPEGMLKNNHQYQGEFNEFDDDLGWNDFALRNYDAQTGRWMQQDPYQEFESPYVGMGNDPINNVDPDGGAILGLTGIEKTIFTTAAGAFVGGMVAATTGGDGKSILKGALLGATVGAGIGTGKIGDLLNIGNSALDVFRSSTQVDNRKIRRSLTDLKHKLDDTEGKLNTWNKRNKKDFKNHFGVDDDVAKNQIKNIVIKEKELLRRYKKSGNYKKLIRRTNTQPPGTFAYVYPNDPNHNIHLESGFWQAKRKGRDSRLGTLAHEMSHFVNVGGTLDHAYGVADAKNLATPANSGKALKNADNFEYYIEGVKL